MTQFPVHVYKSPGNYVTVGKRYKLNSVADQESLDAHLANGWHLTLQAAFDAAGDAANVVKRSADWKTVKKRKTDQRKAFKAARVAATKAAKAPKAAPAEVPSDDAPPTRAELEQQATLLGIRFGVRTTDERLLDRINEAMKGA
jgi:hypothetical protein